MSPTATPLVDRDRTIEPGAFERRIVVLRHRLHELPLFSDEGLERLVANHPRESLAVCGMGSRTDKDSWTEGRHDGVKPGQLLEAVRRGQFWLNMRRIDRLQPEVGKLIDAIYGELEEIDPQLRTTWHNATLLISSPTAFVNFHLDVPCNLLWHIRGVKRVWVYPPKAPSVSAANLAATVAQEQTEMLPYDPEWDRHAEVFDLHPGELISWPQHSPHRVDNLSELNVSLSTEHLTSAAKRRIRVLQANHYLRTRLGVAALGEATRGPLALAKVAGATAYLAARKLLGGRVGAQGKRGYPVTFKIDPDAPGCRVELEQRERETCGA